VLWFDQLQSDWRIEQGLVNTVSKDRCCSHLVRASSWVLLLKVTVDYGEGFFLMMLA
jgi:hypothetical protein